MADLIQMDTDEEIDKYDEATLIASNPPPLATTKNKMAVYNPLNGRNDVLVPLSLGGYVKLGEEPVDRLAEVREYADTLQQMEQPFDMADYEAAGFTQKEVEDAGIMPVTQEKTGRTEPLREGEQLRMMREGSDIVSPSRMFMRDDWNRNTVDLLSAIGVPEQQANQIADFVIGQVDTSGGTGVFDTGIAIVDFTPVGLAFGVEEIGDQLNRSIQTDDKLGIGSGILFLALSAAEAWPLTKAGAKAVKAQIPAMRNALTELGRRMNQPGDMPTTSSFGVGAIDDAAATAKEEGIQISLPAQSNPVVDDLPMVDPDSLLGMKIFPIQADLTRAGGEFTGIDSSQIEVPIALQGGPDFPLLQTSKDGSVVWAVDAKGVSSKKLNKDADYALVLAMSPDSHKTNATVNSAMLETTLAYVRDGRITDEAISQIDALIQKPMGQKQLSRMGTFPGLKSPDAASWMRNATFEERNRIMQVMSSPSVQDMGAPNLQKILDATVDPRYVGLNSNDSIMLIKIDREAGSVKLGEEPGTVPHLSYEYGLKGTPVARVPFVAAKNMFPEWFAERTAKEADMLRMGTASSGEALPLKPLSEAEPNVDIQGPPVPMQGPLQPDRPKPPNTARSFQFSLPVGEVTQEVVNNMKSVAMSEVKSPRQAKLLVNALDGDWVTTAQAKNVGGISALDWIKEARSSPESATLTIPSGDNKTAAKALQADINSGMLTLYKLNDSRTYFGIQKEYNYFDEYGLGPDVDYWTPKANGPELTENETALVSVVSNDFGAKGIGATTVMKAIEEGATVLDAFAVKSDKYPSGFLPTFYATFGFREAGRIKFDPNIVLSEPGGELKLKDMKSAWAKRGWKEGDEFPDIVVMKWTGDENGRSQFTRRFVADNSESAGGQKVAGGFAETARSNGQPIADADGRQRRSSIISGSGGDVSNGNRGSAAGKLADVGREVLNATDEQLENLGIDVDRVRLLRDEVLKNK